MTARQRQVLDFIGEFISTKRFSPSYSEIAAGVGLKSLSAVYKHLDALIAQGYVRKTAENTSRSLEIITRQERISGPPPGKESQLERGCTDILELDGWIGLKTDPVSDSEHGKGFGEPGMPDSLFRRWGMPALRRNFWTLEMQASAQLMWIEWKRPGEKPDPHQAVWHAAEQLRGGLVLVAGKDFAATVEAFQAFYLASGLCRKLYLDNGRLRVRA